MASPTDSEEFILRAAQEAQALLDRAYAAGKPESGSALVQCGLRDGLAIVRDYLAHGEVGVALDHLLYMVNEPSLPISAQSRADISCVAQILGRADLRD